MHVSLPAPDIEGGTFAQALHAGLVDLPDDPAGRSHDEGIVWNDLVLGDQRIRADQAVPADPRPVQNGRAHAHKGVRADGAAVQHHLVADRAVLADRQRVAGIDMEDAAVLDIAAFADLDDVVVGPQDGAEPNAGLAR